MKHIPIEGKHCCTIIIFGGTGDLARKKLIPSIHKLVQDKKLDNFVVIGIAREKLTDKQYISKLKKHVRNDTSWKKLEKKIHYVSLDFYDKTGFKNLDKYIDNLDKKHNQCGNRLFYLATLPQHFSTITKNMKIFGIAKQHGNWTRVVFEKPFGHNLSSAKKINNTIKKVFKENQIYRIDHYLGKELVGNISVLRFTNTIFEPLWNNKHIKNVQIVLSENFGIGTRGRFYDKYGAIKDVVQNHMLQMLALTAMESPKKFTAKFIRDEKVKVLKSIKTTKNVVLGQYIGYKKEKNIKPNSKTETFAAIQLHINNTRWKGVPFYLLTGKFMKKRQALIKIQFENAPCTLLEGKCTLHSNELTIHIQPDEGFNLMVNSKLPGTLDTKKVKMNFCHNCIAGQNTPEAYENLLLDVLKGDQSVFVRSDEIEAQWKIADKIKKTKVYSYKRGSYPKQINKFFDEWITS